MDRTGKNYTEQGKPDPKSQILHILCLVKILNEWFQISMLMFEAVSSRGKKQEKMPQGKWWENLGEGIMNTCYMKTDMGWDARGRKNKWGQGRTFRKSGSENKANQN